MACHAGAVTIEESGVQSPRDKTHSPPQWTPSAANRNARLAGAGETVVSCPCPIFKPERTDGEAHPRVERRARVLPSAAQGCARHCETPCRKKQRTFPL